MALVDAHLLLRHPREMTPLWIRGGHVETVLMTAKQSTAESHISGGDGPHVVSWNLTAQAEPGSQATPGHVRERIPGR